MMDVNNLSGSPGADAKRPDDRWLKAAAWLLGILALVLLFMGTLFRDRFAVVPAVSFNPVTVIRGSYVYLDITGISDELYTAESGTARFFSAEDAGGYLYIVRMKPSELERMSAQNEWWRSRETGDQPEPYRIYGSAVQMSSDERGLIASSMGVDEKQIEDYFGQKYLDTTRSPISVIDICLIVIGGIMMSFSLFILIFSKPYGIPAGELPGPGA